MRLEELHLEGFGHFHQRTIGPISGPVTVFYGPNEAGKSTLLAFIRAILFGFPTRFNSHYPPLAGGQHGGRIMLSNNAGHAYVVERFAGRGGGLSVTTPGGPASDADTALRQLTGPATADLFRTVFAFSLDELQEAASLRGSNIYSAGQGAPGLPALRKSLRDSRGQVYLSRGSNQEVPKLLNILNVVDEQLRAVEGNAGRYGGLTARKRDISGEVKDADARLSLLNARSAEFRNLLNGWNDWLKLTDFEAKLREMPRFEKFPVDPIPRLESYEAQTRQARDDQDEAAELLRLAGEAAAAVIPGENLLNDAGRIEHIRRARSSFDNSVRDLPERQADLHRLETDLSEYFRELGHGWGEEKLDRFDTSMVVRDQVDQWTQRIADGGAHAREAQSRLKQDRRTLESLQAEMREAREKLPLEPPPLDVTALTEHQNALRAARGSLDEYERRRQKRETLRGQLDVLAVNRESQERASAPPKLVIPVLLGLAGIALIITGVVLGEGALLLGVIGGLVQLTIASALWFSGRQSAVVSPSPLVSDLDRQATAADAAAKAARRSLLASAAVLGLASQPNVASLDSEEARLESAQKQLNVWNSANERVKDAAGKVKSQEKRKKIAADDNRAAKTSDLETQHDWRQWLRERSLAETLTADTMSTFFARVDTARASLSEVRRMRDRIDAIQRDIDEFRERVAPLAISHGLPLDPEDQRQLAITADELITRLDEAQTLISQREQAKEQKGKDRKRLKRQEKRLQTAEGELAELLSAAGADGPEEFRRKARQHEERLELERKRDEQIRSLERLSGPGDRFDAFRESLENSEPNKLSEELERLSGQHTDVEGQRNALREERGGIDNELKQLAGEEESSALRIRRSSLLEQLREYAREWSRLTVAQSLLEKTRQKFEQERQPSVIRHAQSFFSSVTGQRYNRLYAPIGEQTITVMDSNGGSRQPPELSRGTREQLYLALRFGLIREFGEHAERLPVVVDEALVNFDPERARLAAEAFAELARTNQVLVFTCHTATRDMFAEVAGAHVVDISPSSS